MATSHVDPAVIAAKRSRSLDSRALATIFTEARSANGFLPEPVPEELLRRVVDLAELGPTSANASPMRLVFVASPEAKERLRPTLSPGNVDKTMAAPVTAIVANDLRFYANFERLFPHAHEYMTSLFGNPDNADMARTAAFRNATLQGAYLMIAARALGLDCGPMSGFDNAKVDAEFFPESTIESNWLINIGYGDDSKLIGPRLPRLSFDEVARII
jgi:3-hydroxypropanoate dehydrogenase